MTGRKEPQNMPDYHKIDYRGFAFVIHNIHGMLLLHCTRKAKKGPHFQLPGGHIDAYEFQYAAEKCGAGASTNEVLLEAVKMGTAREFYEETGIDFRGQLDRFDPTPLFSDDSSQFLNCMMENKCYFTVNVTDDFSNGPRGRVCASYGWKWSPFDSKWCEEWFHHWTVSFVTHSLFFSPNSWEYRTNILDTY